ncbi:uncharacterized protein LOC114527053 isoform X1 [Dendronephthya gigantea]|uniref:uncharacterized protein LOC114527053 isoform X1 n=1 Tax=Dendronephthya gigantea TaxID=151771 RepID=UPI00106D8DA1|nr:uncharacterized protein LOC114527053 isoform X1 [Dendronephthya gigantea]
MKSCIVYVALAVLLADFIDAKSLKTNIFRERRFSPMLNQQSGSSALTESGPQKGCPAMCVRWNTVLKENGQLENTPVVTSPLVPGDTITQCPKQCDPRCCSMTNDGYSHPDQSQGMGGLQSGPQDDPKHPPACPIGCPKACYPACRPGCCNPSSPMSMYQQGMAQQTPMFQPMPQPYVQEPVRQTRGRIPNQALFSYPSQNVQIPSQPRDIISYADQQANPVRSISYPMVQYNPQPEMRPQTRARIPQPFSPYAEQQSYAPQQSINQRSKVPKTTIAAHAATCAIPCSPICAPHCTKHCCESYD